MRASLDVRIIDQSRAQAVPAGRLRRRLVFQRVLRRLGGTSSADRWILKGGYLLEATLGSGARSTRDLDLVTDAAVDWNAVQDALERSLAGDPDRDFFQFETVQVSDLRLDTAGRPGWRFGVTALVAGRVFDRVRIDVLERADEVSGAIGLIVLACPVTGLPFGPARVLAVDVAQHAAEKFHALCRSYAGGRANTRAKDLVDIVLMAEAGLLPDPRLGARLQAVFASRDGTGLPAQLPDPPAAWQRDYRLLTAELQPATTHLDAAFDLAVEIYQRAVTEAARQPSAGGDA